MQNFLDFERPLLDIQSKMEELRHLKDTSENIANELSNLQEKFDKKLSEIYKELTPFQKVKVCRHQDRPKFDDIVSKIFDKSEYLSGDRLFADDSSLKGCLAKIGNKKFLVIGNDKGKDIDSRVKNNFEWQNLKVTEKLKDFLISQVNLICQLLLLLTHLELFQVWKSR